MTNKRNTIKFIKRDYDSNKDYSNENYPYLLYFCFVQY